MAKYKVVYTFVWFGTDSDGREHKTYLDNNGEGMTWEEAQDTARELRYHDGVNDTWVVPFEAEVIEEVTR